MQLFGITLFTRVRPQITLDVQAIFYFFNEPAGSISTAGRIGRCKSCDWVTNKQAIVVDFVTHWPSMRYCHISVLPQHCRLEAVPARSFEYFTFAKPRIYVCICVATWVKCACQPMIWTIAVNVFAQFERLYFFIFFVNVPTWTLNRHCEKGLKYFRLSPILFVLVSLKCILVAAS